jgi:hypothetical protein
MYFYKKNGMGFTLDHFSQFHLVTLVVQTHHAHARTATYKKLTTKLGTHLMLHIDKTNIY